MRAFYRNGALAHLLIYVTNAAAHTAALLAIFCILVIAQDSSLPLLDKEKAQPRAPSCQEA